MSSPQRLGCLGTALLGIVGSYAGGSLAALLFNDKFDLRKASTFIGAVVGSIVVLAVWRGFDGVRKPQPRPPSLEHAGFWAPLWRARTRPLCLTRPPAGLA